MRCPNCQALNPDGAKWCSLCLTAFEQGNGKPAPRVQVREDTPKVQRAWQAVVEKYPGPEQAREGARWNCPVCQHDNSVEVDVCVTCGTSIFDSFGREDEKGSEIPEGRTALGAALLSVIPGLGHLYLGRTLDGVVRGLLGAWWFASGTMLLGAPILMRSVGVMFLTLFFALVMVSGFDAYREIAEPGASPWLSRRMIIFSSLAMVGVSILGAMISIFSVPR